MDTQSTKTTQIPYDLNAEKQRIINGVASVKRDILTEWKQRYFQSPVFPNGFTSINQEVVLRMLSFELSSLYDEVSKLVQLTDAQRNILPTILWEVISNQKWTSLKTLLQERLLVDESVSLEIVQFLNEKFLSEVKELSLKKNYLKQVSAEIPLQLLQALEKYPKINDQQITGERIRIRSEKDTVRGTVRNWLRAYRDVAGVRKHEAMERGQFLFQSENAKRLPQSERDRVALLLKSLDESEPLSINADRQEIIFPAVSSSTRVPRNSPLASEAVRAESTTPEPSMDRPFVAVSTPAANPSWVQNQTPARVAPTTTTHEATHAPRMQASPMKSFNFSKAALGGAAQNQAQAQPSSAPSAQEYRKPAASVQVPAPKPQQESPAFPAANQFRFSSGHMLPSEKSALAERNALRAPKASPAQRSFGSPSYDNRPDASRVMRPETTVPRGLPVQSRKKEVWQVPASLGNVVDLRPDNE